MTTPSDYFLRLQFLHAQRHGWLPYFKEAGYDIPAHILMGIASRETNMQNIIGDSGHGHGVMQIDNRSFPEWCASGKWQDVKEGIRMGAFVLRSKMNFARDKRVPEKDLLRVGIEAYNDGAQNAVDDYFHRQLDLRTTGHDYSRDVLARAAFFEKQL